MTSLQDQLKKFASEDLQENYFILTDNRLGRNVTVERKGDNWEFLTDRSAREIMAGVEEPDLIYVTCVRDDAVDFLAGLYLVDGAV